MIKIKNKICPYEAYETEKVENWLNSMAQKGYALRSIGMFFTEFEEKELCEEKYIVGPYDKSEEYNQTSFEIDYGLTFVTKLAKGMAVYRYTELNEVDKQDIRTRLDPFAKHWAKDNGIYSSLLVIGWITALAIVLCKFFLYVQEGLMGDTAYEYENAVILVPLFFLVVYGAVLVIHKSLLAYKVLKNIEVQQESNGFKTFRIVLKCMLPVVVALAIISILTMIGVYSNF